MQKSSPVIKRSVVINGHKTSVSLEDRFWDELRNIAHYQQKAISELLTEIDQGREGGNFSSAIRLYVLALYRPPVMKSA